MKLKLAGIRLKRSQNGRHGNKVIDRRIEVKGHLNYSISFPSFKILHTIIVTFPYKLLYLCCS